MDSKLKLLLGITDESKDDLLELLMEIANDFAKRNIYPFEDDLDEMITLWFNYHSPNEFVLNYKSVLFTQ